MNKTGEVHFEFFIVLGVCIGLYFVGYNYGEETTQKEAVRNGVAIYESKPDGSASFTWKIPVKKGTK